MLDPQTLAFVFESGVVRFDQDGALHVHLTHSADEPHPLLIHELEAGIAVPAEVAAESLSGATGAKAWRPRTTLPETATLPQGLVLSFPSWAWAQVEMSGDLTVFVEFVSVHPEWLRLGHVHRFARPGGRLYLWEDSAPAPAVEEPERQRLEDPMADWQGEHAAPAP